MKNYFGRESGLATIIRAVVDGSLVPAGYTDRFRGITGYLFLSKSKDLRRYRPVPGMTVPPEGVVNYGEAPAVLGVAAPVIRGLVARALCTPLPSIGTAFRSCCLPRMSNVSRNATSRHQSSPGDSSSTVILLRAT